MVLLEILFVLVLRLLKYFMDEKGNENISKENFRFSMVVKLLLVLVGNL